MTTTRRTKRSGTEVSASTETLAYKMDRVRQQEHSIAFVALQRPLEDAVGLFSQRVEEIMPIHCEKVSAILQEVRQVVQGALATFEERDLAPGVRPYPLLLKLWLLHRELVEAQVLVGNVRGLCQSGRLATDFTGAFWHLRQSLQKVIRGRSEVLAGLRVEVVAPAQEPVATDPCGQYAATA